MPTSRTDATRVVGTAIAAARNPPRVWLNFSTATPCAHAGPAPVWPLEIGAFFRRTETELLLKSRRIVPARLHAAVFRFRHPTWSDAARDLVARRRRTA